jgi:hypothetical protein
MGQRLLVIEHRAEVAHVEPGLQGSETESEQPDGLGSHGLTEAKALIIRHRAAVLAIANALMIYHTLDAVMIHKIIASAPEYARRADWARVQQSAAEFAAHGLEG